MKTNNDFHVYLDETYYSIEEFAEIFDKYNVKNVVFSTPCTKFREPEKSEFMYSMQRKLLMNNFGYFISKYISKSFYNKNDELKLFWKLFSGNNDLIKVMKPDNDYLYNSIKNFDNFKMWFWINPKKNNIRDSNNKIDSYRSKIFGIKFHQYWHNFKLENIIDYISLAEQKELPIYIVLNYQNINEVVKFIEQAKKINIIFGYGGFPLFNKVWDLINNYSNCYIDLASNHIDNFIIGKIFKKIHFKKILFSSDCPYNFKDDSGKFNYNMLYTRLKNLPESAVNYILERNFYINK